MNLSLFNRLNDSVQPYGVRGQSAAATPLSLLLEFGYWSFFGIWCLGFGASDDRLFLEGRP
jgi:hypothetical protein